MGDWMGSMLTGAVMAPVLMGGWLGLQWLLRQDNGTPGKGCALEVGARAIGEHIPAPERACAGCGARGACGGGSPHGPDTVVHNTVSHHTNPRGADASRTL